MKQQYHNCERFAASLAATSPRRLSKSPGIKEILIHKPGPLSEFPAADITSYAAVFRRGIQEVSAILKDVTVKP
jgi:hypothetical protein